MRFLVAACRKRLAVRASSSRRDAADNRLDGNFASSAAGAAYLTASETFRWKFARSPSPFFTPLALRSAAWRQPDCNWIAASVFGGYLFGSALMVLAAIIEMIWGVAAERKPLETVARPLSSVKD
jgi:hypothetical protein